MVAVLSRLFGLQDIDKVMDIVQDTFEAALTSWRFSGMPDHPPAWLMQVAKHKAINYLKQEQRRSSAHASLPAIQGIEQEIEPFFAPGEIRDSQLKLLLLCCHPVLSPRNQIALTLYVLCGFGVPEIANALLIQPEAAKKILTRSKALLRREALPAPFSLPVLSPERLHTTLMVLYLMFNEGYKSTRKKATIDNDLCYEALRLAKLVAEQAGTGGEAEALIALMFFNLSRFPARFSLTGTQLSLEEQDRSRWNKVFIEEAYYYLGRAMPQQPNRFYLEALIASQHCRAACFADTDWPGIAALYRQLERLYPSSMVTLNRILAESYLPGSRSLDDLRGLRSSDLEANFMLPAAEGDICRRMGLMADACDAYTRALALAATPADKEFLAQRIAQCRMLFS